MRSLVWLLGSGEMLVELLWDFLCSVGLWAIRGRSLAGVEQLGLGLRVGDPVGYVDRYHGEKCAKGRMQIRVVTDASP